MLVCIFSASLLALQGTARLLIRVVSLITSTPQVMKIDHPRVHRQACLKIVLGLLSVWFTVSFGCGIIFREWLDTNAPQVGNAPFGFWMAQQGAIICFVLLLLVYAFLMNRLDAKHGYTEHK